MAYQYEEGLPPDALARYKGKISVIGLQSCPFKLPADKWMNNPLKWPNVQYPDIYHYLIKFPRLFSQGAMENYKSLEAYVFFVSGWVHTVMHIETSTGNLVLKADVKPSWRVTEEPHHPWAAVTTSGSIIAAHCDCKAGLGETCSHVGALLFKIESAVRLGYTSVACTDLPCKWNGTYTKNVQPARVKSIKFYKEVACLKVQKSRRVGHRKTPLASTEEDQDRFLAALSSCSKTAVGLSGFDAYRKPFISAIVPTRQQKFPQPLRTLFKESYQLQDTPDFKESVSDVFRTILVTEEEANSVEVASEGQASAMIWHEQRTGRITASVAHGMLHTNVNNPAPSLIKKICTSEPYPLNTPAVVWGRKHEDDAMQVYRFLLLDTPVSRPSVIPADTRISHPVHHTNCQIRKTGFRISCRKPFLGATPDAIVECTCCGKGVVEIKCPYKYRSSPLCDATEDPNFCLDKDLELKMKHQYYTQVQLQMFVCEANYADFVVWMLHHCIVIRVTRDNDFIKDMLHKLELVWTAAVLPELMTRQLETGPLENKENEAQGSSGNTTYCVCQATNDEGEMVACDSCNQWYHPQCVRLKGLPKTKVWYCPSCRKIKKRTKNQP